MLQIKTNLLKISQSKFLLFLTQSFLFFFLNFTLLSSKLTNKILKNYVYYLIYAADIVYLTHLMRGLEKNLISCIQILHFCDWSMYCKMFFSFIKTPRSFQSLITNKRTKLIFFFISIIKFNEIVWLIKDIDSIV